ncbi:PREDICTED: uncharacterized protein LOC109238461 [Nicotiana attenuata]|uniref:uncharacterized protein LOC109238461 n=1 Tax=Nicotiana attenuata TaxID=49451 RepID=UPI000904E709|nr:PREDICTED: uncharacterized protein LOC109238461 [Nicotiana attenuata]
MGRVIFENLRVEEIEESSCRTHLKRERPLIPAKNRVPHLQLQKLKNELLERGFLHRDITESLLYLTASRLDIVIRVGFYARSQSNPKDSHLKASVGILRYPRGTQDLHPVVVKCCGPSNKLEELESNSRGPNTVTAEDKVADIFTKSLGKKAF